MATSPTPAPFNPLPLLFLWAIWGAVADFRYQRRGGQKPTRADRWTLLGVIVLCVGFAVLLGALGGTARALGSLSAFLTVIVFGFWEIGRWRVRRRYPLSKIVTVTKVTSDAVRTDRERE